ncbi:MAG TPA: hypothetical protein DCY54_04840 [Parachlamydiales bacterium]|nr:hypothetical protein [Parachlamydiales bacterium]
MHCILNLIWKQTEILSKERTSRFHLRTILVHFEMLHADVSVNFNACPILHSQHCLKGNLLLLFIESNHPLVGIGIDGMHGQITAVGL